MKLKQLLNHGLKLALDVVQANDPYHQMRKSAEKFEAELNNNNFKNINGFNVGVLLNCPVCGDQTMTSSIVKDTDTVIQCTCTCKATHNFSLHIQSIPTCIKNEIVITNKSATLTFLSFDRL